MEMPGVFFDDDKYYIDPAYQSALHQVLRTANVPESK